VHFGNWNFPASLDFKKENNSAIIQSDFFLFKISLSPEKRVEDHFYYDKSNHFLIFYTGKIFLNDSPITTVHLISLYKEKRDDLFKSLSGFFSMVVFDFTEKRVKLITDSIGLLRIYYHQYKDTLHFSNEINELIKYSGNRISKEGLIQFFLLNYYVDENTIYNEIKRICPASIVTFTGDSIEKKEYLDLVEYLSVECQNDRKSSYPEIAEVLKKLTLQYAGKKPFLTLTSGYDSRLLLAALLSNNISPTAFTFGIKNNLEFIISSEISKKIDGIKYFQIELNEDFENYLNGYFNYINKTKNIELNFNRYHYIYSWEKIKREEEMNVLTGICGDAFTRDGLSESYQSNRLLLDLIYTGNKKETIRNFVLSKTDLLDEVELEVNECINYLENLFYKITDNNKYKNHFIIKINYVVRNYFGTECNSENNFLDTYPVFLDQRYLTVMANSDFSIFNNRFLDNTKSYKLISHKYYYQLIKNLYNPLNEINTNRGFPLKYSDSLFYLPLRIYLNRKMRKKKYKSDLNYDKWVNISGIKKDNFSFEDSVKLKVLSTLN
jgi:hypothetical protein